MHMPICRLGPAVHYGSAARRSIVCQSASPQPAQENHVQFTYRSEDGRKKATLEDVFSTTTDLLPEDTVIPWQFNWQMNERVLVWSDDLKARLVKV